MANAIFQIGPYELKNELGRGKTGIVYEAIKPSDKQVFAVKILHPNLTLEEQVPSYLDKKLEQISRLNHPNIVQILDYGQAEGRYYIVSPKMPYGSLMDQIAQYGALNQLQAKAILENVLYGLQYLHQLGLSHGNLHPGNILIDSQGVARISDFGVSELMSEAQDLQAQSGGNKPERLGKPGYIAPELRRGNHPDPQSDIFSLGCIAHEMLTGKRPFEAERPDQFQEQGLQPKLALSDELSQEWRAFIEKCLAVDPLERYRSAGAAFEDLRWGLFAGANRLGKETDVLKIDYEDGSEPDSETDLLHNRIEWIAAQEDQPYVEQWYGLDPYAPTPGQALEMQSMQKQRSSKTLTILLSVVVLLAVIVGVLLLRTRKQRVDLKDPNIRIVLNDLVKADIHEIQLSPDGKTIAIASSNGIYFYNSKTLEEENAIANELDINSIAWSPNGKFVVSGGKDNTVRLWNTKDDDEIYQMLGHQKPINRVVFSGDGLKIASGSQDRTIRLWDTGTGEELNSLSGHSGPVNALAFSPDDETLASGSDDGTVRVWNVETGEQITEFDTGAETVVMVEYTGNGQQIYTGYANEDTEVWDLDTGERVQTQEDDDPDILDGLADEEPPFFAIVQDPTATMVRQNPTQVPAIPTQIPPTPTAIVPTNTPIIPTNTPLPAYASVEVGPSYYLTYNSQLWKPIDSGGLQKLQLKNDEACTFNYDWGHGIDPDRFDVDFYYKTIGNTEFSITRWYYKSNLETVLYGYRANGRYISVEHHNALAISDECMALADEVMQLSEAKNFGP